MVCLLLVISKRLSLFEIAGICNAVFLERLNKRGRWMGRMADMGENINVFKVFMAKPKVRGRL
jgi:hypothetical protein